MNYRLNYLMILVLVVLSPEMTKSQHRLGIIDDRDRANLTLASKKNPFYNIIYESVTTGRKGLIIKAYRDTSFNKIITSQEILKIGSGEETFQIYPDPTNPDEFYDTTVFVPFNPEKISHYLVLYEPYKTEAGNVFNIIAIAPLTDNWVGGVRLNEQVMFWVKYSDFAEIAGKEIFYSPDNPGGELTFKDFFERNMFYLREYDPTIVIKR